MVSCPICGSMNIQNQNLTSMGCGVIGIALLLSIFLGPIGIAISVVLGLFVLAKLSNGKTVRHTCQRCGHMWESA